MPRDKFKLGNILQEQWCEPGEQLIYLGQPTGHIGSTIGLVTSAPHSIVASVPPANVPQPQWPLPTLAVSQNRFLMDEWAHDPAIWAWSQASHHTHAASRLADLFANARAEGAFAITTIRLAFIIESGFANPPTADEQSSGGLFRRIQSLAPTKRDVGFTTWWQAPRAALTGFFPVMRGRSIYPEWFVRASFMDGSVLDIREASATQIATTVQLNLRQ